VTHIPVLLQEVVQGFNPKPSQNFIDATINGGGHAEAILEGTHPDGELLGIDQDREQLRRCGMRLDQFRKSKRLFLAHVNFYHISEIARIFDFGPISGILFDLGLSSYHIEESGRGFSFQKNEPLDMRFDSSDTKKGGMNPTLFGGGYRRGSEEGGLHSGSHFATAEDIVQNAGEKELAVIFRLYGEERYAARIAREIIEYRKKRRISTTAELRTLILAALPGKKLHASRIHPATRIFQALRIAVNNELYSLFAAIPRAFFLLAHGGRLAVISYHSLEDRIVKRWFRHLSREGRGVSITAKPVFPALSEKRANPRSRSARLRIIERRY